MEKEHSYHQKELINRNTHIKKELIGTLLKMK